MGMSCLWNKAWQRYQCCEEYIGRGIKKNSIRELLSRAGTARINACGDSRLRGQWSRKPIGFRQWVVHIGGLVRDTDYTVEKRFVDRMAWYKIANKMHMSRSRIAFYEKQGLDKLMTYKRVQELVNNFWESRFEIIWKADRQSIEGWSTLTADILQEKLIKRVESSI